MHSLYVLRSLKRKRYYIGVSADVEARLKAHNGGGTRSTKPYRPWKLIYTETHPTKQEACKREYLLKSPKGYLEKLRIIAEHDKGGFA